MMRPDETPDGAERMRQRLRKLGCAGPQGGTQEGGGGTPAPIPTLPSAELQGSVDGLSIQDPTSQLCIHPFQRASSKQVYTARRKETIAHSHHADSLSFQSSFLKQWGTDASGERTKSALRTPWACKAAETARAGSRRPAPAKQPWCSGALQRPRGAAHTAGQGRKPPSLGAGEPGAQDWVSGRRGDAQERHLLLLQAGRPAR